MSHVKFWGPYCWYLLHTISFSYQDHKRNYYQHFFNLIGEIIPCLECKKHFKKHLINFPPPITKVGEDTLEDWVINIHNIVNKYLKKNICSHDDAKNLYWVDDILPINHKYIHDFIKIISNSDVNPVKFILFLQTLAYIFPCPVCSNALINCVETSYIKKIVNGQINKKFVAQYLQLIQENHLTDFDHTLLQKQKFSVNPIQQQRGVQQRGVVTDEDEYYTEKEASEIILIQKKIHSIKKNSMRGKIVTRATKQWK